MNTQEAVSLIGQRLKKKRIDMGLKQLELSEHIGLNVKVVQNAESGRNLTLLNFLKILEGLGVLDEVNSFLPEPEFSPIEIARMKGKIDRKRVRDSHKGKENTWEW